MKGLIFVTAAMLAGSGMGYAQDTASDLFRIFEPEMSTFDRIGYCVDGDEAVLTYGSAEERDGVTEYWFGIRQPVIAWDSYTVYDEVEENGETKYVDRHLPVTAIGTYAVQHTDIRSFFTGNNVKVLYDYALHLSKGDGPGECRLVLGRSVERLGHRAIVGDGLGMIVVAAEVPPVWTDDESIVLDNAAQAVIAVPDGSVSAYEADARWSKLGDIRPFSEYGLDKFADVDYVTYRVQFPDFWIADGEIYDYMAPKKEIVGYVVRGDEASLTYSEIWEVDCIFGEPIYRFIPKGDFVTPDAIEYDGKRYPVTAVLSEAVNGNSGLTSFDTGDNVATVYDNAIYLWADNAMTSVRLGSSVKVIGDRGLTIDRDASVGQLIVAAQEPPVWASTQSVLVDNPEAVMLVVPDESMDAYKSHRYWSRFTDIHPFSEFGYEGVESIATDMADGAARYYNLQGMPVANPANGIYIKVEADRTSKVRL